MANAEHTASLPPIIEDESDENLLPMFYQKELERKDYRSHEKNSPSNKRDFSEQTNETQLPYNSWKAKNRMLSKSGENRIPQDMVSRLGQSLENCHSVVPGRSQEGYQPSNHPHNVYIPDNSAYQAHGVINHTEQGFVSPSNDEMKRYHRTHQDVPKIPVIFDSNYIQNSMPPAIYASGYPGFILNSNKNIINPNGNSPFHGGSTISNSFKPCDASPTSFKLQSSPKSSCNPHSRNPGFHYENHSLEKVPYQNSCCQSAFTNKNTYMDGLASSDGHHINYANTNYEHPIPSHHNSKQQKSSCHCCHDLEPKSQKKDKRTEKNMNKQINDLYRIVWLQNQQLIQLQNDLKKLIEYSLKNEDRNQKLSEHEHLTKKQSKSTMEKRMFNLHVIEENKNLMEKVSVGIMTSFIDTTSVNKKKSKKDIKKKKEIEPPSHDSSSESETSSVESSSEEKERAIAHRNVQKKIGGKKNKSRRTIEDSILLNGIDIPAFENAPSPNGSLNIDMQDYASSSDSDSSDSSDRTEDKPAPVGWTFYDKVVGKVNNMLNESESEESENEIRNKTLEQLRKLGVTIEDSPTSKRVTFNEAAYIPQQQKLFLGESDTSMKMNALAMKYLQDKTTDLASPKSPDKCTGGIANSTNLSVATLRYLEKYHLPVVTNSPENKSEKSKKKKEKRKEEKKPFKKKSKSSDHSGKILDITAIKQQPKLLPKTQ